MAKLDGSAGWETADPDQKREIVRSPEPEREMGPQAQACKEDAVPRPLVRRQHMAGIPLNDPNSVF
jgi:hypothetical protein